MLPIASRARDLRYRDASMAELRRFFADRDLYFKECERYGILIDDYIELSPVQWPDRWLPESQRRSGRRR